MPEVQAAIDCLTAAIAAITKAQPSCPESQKAWRIVAARDEVTNARLTLQEILAITN